MGRSVAYFPPREDPHRSSNKWRPFAVKGASALLNGRLYGTSCPASARPASARWHTGRAFMWEHDGFGGTRHLFFFDGECVTGEPRVARRAALVCLAVPLTCTGRKCGLGGASGALHGGGQRGSAVCLEALTAGCHVASACSIVLRCAEESDRRYLLRKGFSMVSSWTVYPVHERLCL